MINEDPTKRLTKAFSEVLDAPHAPTEDWVSVGRGFIAETIDHLDWLEHGIAEWCDEALTAKRQAEAARATARVASTHLNTVLNGCRTAAEQQAADTAARDWLLSIGA